MFTACLDTCVLWPSLQRDFLLSLAVEGLYRAVWSARILDELEYGERAKWTDRGLAPEDARKRAQHLVRQMRSAFDDAEITGWEGLEGSYGLPDPDDEHVLAAAVVGGAGAIVTHNLKDFPADRLPSGLVALAPAEFAANTVTVDPGRALAAVEQISARSGRSGPQLRVHDVLHALQARYGMDQAVRLIRSVR